MLVSTVASLRDPRDNEPPVSNEKEAALCATAESNVRCRFSGLEFKY